MVKFGGNKTLDSRNYKYRLLELTALSGELSTDAPSRLGISPDYTEKLITQLKADHLLKTHYRDKLRGYRLTSTGKKMLLAGNRERFTFYLSGNTETNQPRSDLPRRLRLQQASRLYVLLQNAGICYFRDKKPPLFHPSAPPSDTSLSFPVFYHARELKELGDETIKINNSRSLGILLADGCIYVLFYTGDALLKWEYHTELRLKTLLSFHINQGRLSGLYPPGTPIRAVFIGTDMEMSVKLLNSTGGFRKSFFYLDTSFESFYYLPDSSAGEVILKLLCEPFRAQSLRSLLLSDLGPASEVFPFYHDALQEGEPVLLCHDFDMLKISHFLTALNFGNLTGRIICFDFQADALLKYCGSRVSLSTIDLEKFERRFFT